MHRSKLVKPITNIGIFQSPSTESNHKFSTNIILTGIKIRGDKSQEMTTVLVKEAAETHFLKLKWKIGKNKIVEIKDEVGILLKGLEMAFREAVLITRILCKSSSPKASWDLFSGREKKRWQRHHAGNWSHVTNREQIVMIICPNSQLAKSPI